MVCLAKILSGPEINSFQTFLSGSICYVPGLRRGLATAHHIYLLTLFSPMSMPGCTPNSDSHGTSCGSDCESREKRRVVPVGHAGPSKSRKGGSQHDARQGRSRVERWPASSASRSTPGTAIRRASRARAASKLRPKCPAETTPRERIQEDCQINKLQLQVHGSQPGTSSR